MAEWMAFNVADYASNTLHLKTRQHGAYILLICAAWKAKGRLPGSDDGLMAITKLTPKEWRADGDILKSFLTRRGDAWVHERVEFEWQDSQLIIDGKRKAGKKGARKRWQGRTNGTGMAQPSQNQHLANGRTMAPPSFRQWQNDAPLPMKEEEEDSDSSLAVTESGTAREPASEKRGTGRSGPIEPDWQPSASAIGRLRTSRPDLDDATIALRTVEFHAWCAATAKTTFNPDATWLGFMVKTHAQHSSTARNANGSAPTVADGIAAAFARRSVPPRG